MKYLKNFEQIKKFENKIKQQPFYLKGSDRLYISDELAKKITPTISDKKGTDFNDFIYQKNVDFLKNTKYDYKSSSGHIHNIFVSKNVSTGIKVRFNRIYSMSIFIKRGTNHNNEFGKFQYYIGGISGDSEMHGKNMVRATRECNLNFIIKLYPIVKYINNFYKKLKNEPFFDIIKNEIIKNNQLVRYMPLELENDNDISPIISLFKYNL